MITRLAHVCLKTADLSETVAFYTQGLGAEPVFKFTKKGSIVGVYLRLAEQTFIEFFEDAGQGPATDAPALDHFCFETDDIEADRQRFVDAGFEPGAITLGCDDSLQFWVTDPNRVRFEFHQYTAASAQCVGGDREINW